MFDTPLLILGFNRPDLFSDLLIKLRDLAPTNVYIAVDGPREGNKDDEERVERTVLSIRNIDWQCNLRTLVRETNLGCGRAVSSAISWVMKTETKVIVLEDDIRPNKSFFEFCAKALVHFSEDERIMTVGGHSLIETPDQNNVFRLSRYPEIWGWATWRRSWNLYEFSIDNLPRLSFRKLLSCYGGNVFLALQSSRNFRNIKTRTVDTWDYQLQYCSFLYNKLHVIPNLNLTDNVGFNNEATHTKYFPVPSPPKRDFANIDFRTETIFADSFDALTRGFLQTQLFASIKTHIVERSKVLKRFVLSRLPFR